MKRIAITALTYSLFFCSCAFGQDAEAFGRMFAPVIQIPISRESFSFPNHIPCSVGAIQLTPGVTLPLTTFGPKTVDITLYSVSGRGVSIAVTPTGTATVYPAGAIDCFLWHTGSLFRAQASQLQRQQTLADGLLTRQLADEVELKSNTADAVAELSARISVLEEELAKLREQMKSRQ
ncbi:hypothetical protein HFO91_30540 [Rhizobium leguminosarum]|uniref:hypothetical protein n=1 Tax=Rhizobium leguminosarum TaxID=384 RepID=UPI001C9468BD|nr:hypothetical protein [Rhizobium leguminosarum]MBY5453919.1 hypothetical protein [Rhizobium leguminosarum]